MPRFPLKAVAKSRTPEDHLAYYRWVNFVNGEDPWTGHRVIASVGWRTRWFHTFMDLTPRFVWRRLPIRWKTRHLFEDLE